MVLRSDRLCSHCRPVQSGINLFRVARVRFLALRCWWHKFRARAADDVIVLIEEAYDCGQDLIRIMSYRYVQAEARFEEHRQWLEDNDPKYPKP